jgi:hypothetical protein
MPVFFKKLVADNDRLNSTPDSHLGIERIEYSLENNIKSGYPDKKLYSHHDKIFMTFDEPACTHLVEIDPIAHRSSYKKLNFALEKGNATRTKQGNSFLYDNRLFRVTISPEQMNLSILDLDSIKLINSYNFYPEDEIGINNGPIVQDGGTTVINMQNEKVLEKPQQYFRNVINGNLSVAANKIGEDKYEVEIGSYEKILTGRSGLGSTGLSVGIGIGMGGMGFRQAGSGFREHTVDFQAIIPMAAAVPLQRSAWFILKHYCQIMTLNTWKAMFLKPSGKGSTITNRIN